MNREDDIVWKEKIDYFIFIYIWEGNFWYFVKFFFSFVLGFIFDNVDYIDFFIGFFEQIVEKLFFVVEVRQKFIELGVGLRVLQKFIEVYGSLVFCFLCL